MFFRLLVFAAAVFFVVWVFRSFITPFFKTDKPVKRSSETKEDGSLLDEYNENEVTYRTKQNELASKSEEQLRKAQELEAEAQTIQEQIKNK